MLVITVHEPRGLGVLDEFEVHFVIEQVDAAVGIDMGKGQLERGTQVDDPVATVLMVGTAVIVATERVLGSLHELLGFQSGLGNLAGIHEDAHHVEMAQDDSLVPFGLRLLGHLGQPVVETGHGGRGDPWNHVELHPMKFDSLDVVNVDMDIGQETQVTNARDIVGIVVKAVMVTGDDMDVELGQGLAEQLHGIVQRFHRNECTDAENVASEQDRIDPGSFQLGCQAVKVLLLCGNHMVPDGRDVALGGKVDVTDNCNFGHKKKFLLRGI